MLSLLESLSKIFITRYGRIVAQNNGSGRRISVRRTVSSEHANFETPIGARSRVRPAEVLGRCPIPDEKVFASVAPMGTDHDGDAGDFEVLRFRPRRGE